MLAGAAVGTGYGFDVADRLTSIVDPLGASWSYVYDGRGNGIQATDPDLGSWS